MKIRYVLILMAMIVSTVGFTQEKTLKAFYTDYDEESQLYYFEDADGNSIEFNYVKSDVLKKFSLNTLEFIDQAFLITYTIKEIDDEDDSYEELTIVNLKPTDLVGNEDPEDDDE